MGENFGCIIIGATLTLMVQFTLAVIVIEVGHHRHMGIGHAMRKALTGVIRNPVVAGPALGFLWWLSGLHLPDTVEQCTRMPTQSECPKI